ncbi:hypothetical protein [Streptomyces sp. JB150]|uniref:hypothetical protein n=1 Tax=Streptomyces sp. JB150 TaxID=2714844 RepID=UPI001F1131E2|nr:hypothetical protein [Streptomyces sp. JB150]
MPIPVHALAHRPLTTEAVAEFVALPAVPHIPDDEDALDAELDRRGWSPQHELVCDSFLTGYGHVLCTDALSPFGQPDARQFLVFGELYPVDPEEDGLDNERWLYGLMDAWQRLPGWTGRRPSTDQDCEAVLAQAERAVTEHLGTAPERIVKSSDTLANGPALTHRIWRTPTHALILGPAPDNGPYGYLTHLQLSCTPLTCGPELPSPDDAAGLTKWIGTHVDW